MANFNVTLQVGISKGAMAEWSYNSSTTGVGTTSGNPLDLEIGDTVTFIRHTSSAGDARVLGLAIFTNNADITITSGSVVRTVASGALTADTVTGTNNGGDQSDLFYFERQAAPSITAPTASSVTFNNPASTNTTATVNLSASGTGGTLEYACEVGDTTPDNWQTGSTFTITRGTGTVYAQARRSSTATSSVVSATRPAFLIGDTGVNPSSTTIGYSDTSASTVVTYGTYGEAYSVRVNNGSTNLGATIANSVGTATISFTSSLPTAGNTTTYEIFVRRPTSTGGDGSTYHATNDTFTVTRSAADTTPNAFDFTNQTGVALNSTRTSANTVTIAGLSTGVTASVTISGGQYSKNLAAYSTVSGITATNGDTFKLRHTSSTSNGTNTTTTLTVGGVAGSFVSTTVGDTTAPVITVTSGTDTVERGGSWTDAGATANGGETVTSSGTVNTSVVGTYTITYSATDSSNNTGTATRTVTIVDTTAPIITRLGSATVTLNVGGTYSDAGATAADNNGDGTITSSIVTVNPVNVNAAGTYTVTYNVSDSAGNAATQVTRSVTVYAVPDITITDILNKTESAGSTTFTVTIAAGSSTTIYEVKDYNTNPATGTVHVSQTGNGTMTVPDMPSSGAAKSYMVTGRLPVANDGDNTPSLADTFEVFLEGTSGSTTGGGGSGTYGMRVWNASNEIILDVTDRVVVFRERVTGSIPAADLTKTVTLSGNGTCALNLSLPQPLQTTVSNVSYTNTHLIVWATISGTALTIHRKSTQASNNLGSTQVNELAPYDFLVLYDPET